MLKKKKKGCSGKDLQKKKVLSLELSVAVRGIMSNSNCSVLCCIGRLCTCKLQLNRCLNKKILTQLYKRSSYHQQNQARQIHSVA